MLDFTDDVSGHIIGGDNHKYQFWQKNTLLDSGYFASDAEAEGHCKAMFPQEYAQGIEMRCFDGTRTNSPFPTNSRS